MNNKGAIFAGAVGGVGPNVLRLIVNYSSPSPQHIITQPTQYFLSMLGFAVLGALVVWVFQETDLKRALYIGVGLPSLLQVGTLQLAPSSKTPEMAPPLASAQASFSLISTAYAQVPTPPAPFSLPGRRLNLIGDKNARPYTVLFYGSDNTLRSTQPVTNPASQTVDVPETADKFAIQIGESISPSYELPKTSNATKNVEVQINEKTGSGFLQGVGLAKGVQYEITAKVEP
jgi:hypothetical protein